MATTFHCDWCGEEIEGAREHPAVLKAGGCAENGDWLHSPEFHYHATGDLSCLGQAIELLRCRSERPATRPVDRNQQLRNQRDYWMRTPNERREAYAFQLLGDARLTIAEITDLFQAELEPDAKPYETDIRSLVTKMFKAGQLEREGEEWRSRIRYRYFRKCTLEGPIADLQAQLDDQADEEGA